MSLPAKNTSAGEIEHIIKQLPIKKSPGYDLISNFITKNLPKKIIIFYHTYSTPSSDYRTFQTLGNTRSLF